VRFFVILLILAALFSLYLALVPRRKDEHKRADTDGDGWEYGDEWKQGSPDEPVGEGSVEYIEILRGDTGTGYDDSVMIDFVGYLGSKGIRATYDSFSLGLEPAAIKTYVLKVESGREAEALALLKDKR